MHFDPRAKDIKVRPDYPQIQYCISMLGWGLIAVLKVVRVKRQEGSSQRKKPAHTPLCAMNSLR